MSLYSSTGFWIEDHFNTPLVTISNYSAIANLHILQIVTAHFEPSQAAVTSSFPVTDLNNGDSSVSVLTSLLPGEYPTTELNSSQSQSYVTTDGSVG
jgi:hypothetical protein